MRMIDADRLVKCFCAHCTSMGEDGTCEEGGDCFDIKIIKGTPTIKIDQEAENQNAVEPIRSKDADVWYCGNCDEIVGEETLTVGGIQNVRHKYCPECGRKVKWHETD